MTILENGSDGNNKKDINVVDVDHIGEREGSLESKKNFIDQKSLFLPIK